MKSRSTTRSRILSGKSTLPKDVKRSYFKVYMHQDGTVEFGQGGGKIPVKAGNFYEPLVCPTSEVVMDSQGGYILEYAGTTEPDFVPNIWVYGDAVADGSVDRTYGTIVAGDPSVLETGETYIIEFDYDISFGSLQLLCGNAGPLVQVGQGSVSAMLQVDTASFFRVRQTTKNTIGSMTNITVTKV